MRSVVRSIRNAVIRPMWKKAEPVIQTTANTDSLTAVIDRVMAKTSNETKIASFAAQLNQRPNLGNPCLYLSNVMNHPLG